MCVDIWNKYRGCNHKQYQNTSLCHVARRCTPETDTLLEKTKFLPDKPPKIPPGLFQCKLKVATLPKDSKCPQCAREERGAKASRNGTMSSTNSKQSTLGGRRITNPSPDEEGVKRLRDSLIMLENFRKPS